MSESHLNGLIECTNEQYHSGPGISKSKLDAIAVSPLNYWDQHINPDREPREYKHCFAVGDGTHKLILEPGEFEKHYFVGFDKSAHPDALDTTDDMKKVLAAEGLMTSGTKPALIDRLINEADYPADMIMMLLEKQHAERNAGRIPMPAKDYKNMLGMLNAVNRHPWAGGLLSGASTEQSFYWTDADGILRKCRTDSITANGEWVVDLKTTDDVSLAGFGATIAKRRYEVQAAWYLDILRGLYGDDAPRGFAFIAAQKTRPFDVAVHWLTDEQIERGRRLYQRDLARLMECFSTNLWPGADGGDLLQAKLPYWAEREFEYA